MIARWFHTVRHLRPRQIAYRILRSLPRRKPRSGPPPPLAEPREPLVEPVRRESAFEPPDRFRFLAREERVADAGDWSRDDLPLLWLYHLHYFHDLTARGASERADELERLIVRWVRENPPLRRPAWDPYPTALRIPSWIRWARLVRPLPEEAVESLAVQARHLASSLEIQHGANHLLADAVGLVFAGCYFGGAEGEGWRRRGLEILTREVQEQVLPDGGHYERSPSYHALVLEALLDAAAVLRCYGHPVPGVVTGAVTPLLAWARLMTHPDGGFAQLNDAPLDGGPDAGELAAYAARLGLATGVDQRSEPSRWQRVEDGSRGLSGVLLPDTGYARIESGPATAFLDLAPLGPDYNPGHGHADTLTFELSLDGHRVVVDPGVSTYEVGRERSAQRGTAAHNTVTVDGRDSSQVWASFRVARRARVVGARLERREGELLAEAAHDGYLRQRVAGLHARRWRLGRGYLVVEDLVEGRGSHELEVGFLLHPDVDPVLLDGPRARLSGPEGLDVGIELDPALQWSLEPALWHPGFGRGVETRRVTGWTATTLPRALSQRFVWR